MKESFLVVDTETGLVDGYWTHKVDALESMDVSHNKALAQGGTNKDGVKVESASANRSRNLKKKKKSPRRLA